MKFSASVIFAAATMAGVNALPDGFIEHCCVVDDGVFTLDNSGIYLNIANYNSANCLDTSTCPGEVLDFAGLCATLPGGDAIPCTTELEQLNCCDPVFGNVRGDIPWTCTEAIQDFGRSPGPVEGPKGYYCGRALICKDVGTVCGDPHFQTWEGEWYDFHGECDLVFVSVPEFGQGLGLDIQLRTKARYEYSYVESAALRIGDDVLEVGAYGQYFYNGVESAGLDGVKMAGLYEVTHEAKDKKDHVFKVILGGPEEKQEAVVFKAHKDLVAVKMENAYETFQNSVGMMGDYHTGERLGRDGKTIISDDVEFGMEWQVRPEEPMLFQSRRAPQLADGQKCIMPSKSAAAERRRLGASDISKEDAEAACAAVDHIHHANCVYDVMATGDLDAVHAGVF